MKPYVIGIIREGKIPADNRTPLTPRQCHELMEWFPELRIQAEWSPIRCYTDEDYTHFHIPVKEYVHDVDLLLGIKEVPIDRLLEGKTYMFFSHTHKKQSYNRPLLRAILDKKITLIDYELVTDEKGVRMIGFGRWAGIVGAHYALLMLGERRKEYTLKPAHQCINLQELVDQYENIEFPAVKFAITGTGRVAEGALEIMEHAQIRQVSKEEYLNQEFDHPVFVQLKTEDLYKSKDGSTFNKTLFHSHPEEFDNAFVPVMDKTDVLINCIFWHPLAPRLFEIPDLKKPDFKMFTIADISCDIDGSVPITTTITYTGDPVLGYHIEEGKFGKPYQGKTIDLMAIATLPNELPKDASRDFGLIMKNTVIPKLLEETDELFFERATIAKEGALTPRFAYLQDFVDGKE